MEYTISGSSLAASDLSPKRFKALERQLLGLPHIPDVDVRISDKEYDMMALMLSRVTIKIVHGPSIYLHETFLIMQACRMQGEDMPLQEPSIESLIGMVKSALEEKEKEQRLNCTCEAHNLMLDSIGTEFSTLLLSLQKFDFRVTLNYQSGGQIIADLFNFI